jgi:hypothetical protein
MRVGSWAAFERQLLQRIFDAITFSTSVVLLVGLMDATVLAALGSTKPFLFAAGMLGFFYSIIALRPKGRS